jgi:predicted O-linked N-acetylglucosamine transferase (SPINDLY family)
MLARRGRRPRSTAEALNRDAARLMSARELGAAESLLRQAIDQDPAYAPAYANLGVVRLAGGHVGAAIEAMARSVELAPGHTDVRLNLADTLARNWRLEDAIAHYREVLARDPQNARARSLMLRPLLEICDWAEAEAQIDFLVSAWRADPAGPWADEMLPFDTVVVTVPPALRLEVARRYAARVRARVAGARPVPRSAVPRTGGRIRIGYCSADFYDHATAHLAAGLFERHDRSRFEIVAYSFGPDDGSEYRRRLIAAFDRFVDVRDESFQATARRIAGDGIDILVDLKGYTGGARSEIFALRPAPVQVNFLGYPGTTGADFMDYIIADRTVVPAEDRRWYAENVVWMPCSYQVNDDRQPVAPEAPRRVECGLPQTGAVLACFNNNYKIDASVFAAWMRILAAVPGAVLWLLEKYPAARAALEAAAERHGIARTRLVFSPRVPKAQHLARLRHADLFLDTWRCNAHTTASDALWVDVPVLTRAGSGLATRVAASLLQAVGLPELVARDSDDYVGKAVALARAPERLRALRETLATNKLTAPLFDTARYTRDLERAYSAMWARHERGELPSPLELEAHASRGRHRARSE